MDTHLPTLLQQYLHKSKYARYRDDKLRRESWEETVSRYIDFSKKHISEKYGQAKEAWESVSDQLEQAILNTDVMPSMRLMMTAGPAVERDNMASYNCLAGETRVLTREYCSIEIEALTGLSAHVVVPGIGWVLAEFKAFGKQRLKEITLTRLEEDGVTRQFKIYATGGHNWVVNGHEGFLTTDDLRRGYEIPCVSGFKRIDHSCFIVEYVCDTNRFEEVFCAVVPKHHVFTLEHGILTGNCFYSAVNKKRRFADALYILLNGTGVGFSCERQEINRLPTIPDQFTHTDDVISVKDSQKGWAQAYRKVIDALYQGEIPKIDYSKVRPAGARLKTFGGRASGHQALKDLVEFTIDVFKKAHNRKLTSLEVHDIMCKIGEVVVIGGVEPKLAFI